MDSKRINDFKRSSVLDAIYILNDLFDSLVAGTMVFDSYQSRFIRGEISQTGIVAVQKMCVSHLILALNRLCEFWARFHHLVPDELRPELKALVSRLDNPDVKEFRNTVVAHIWNKGRSLPPTQAEAMALLNRISGHPGSFLLWLNNPKDHAYPRTVVSIVQTLRDRLCEQHGVSAAEVFQR